MTALAGMTETVTVTRRTTTTDAEGRPTGSASTVATVSGLVAELSATELPQGGSLGEQTTAQAVVPSGTAVAAQDELAVTFPSGLARTYRVVSVHDAVACLLVDLHRDG